jgi:hypothetical protein
LRRSGSPSAGESVKRLVKDQEHHQDQKQGQDFYLPTDR